MFYISFDGLVAIPNFQGFSVFYGENLSNDWIF